MSESRDSYVQREGKYAPPSNHGLAKEGKSSHIGYIFNPTHGYNERNLGVSIYQERTCGTEKRRAAASVCPATAEAKQTAADLHKTSFVLGFAGPTFKSEAAEKYATIR